MRRLTSSRGLLDQEQWQIHAATLGALLTSAGGRKCWAQAAKAYPLLVLVLGCSGAAAQRGPECSPGVIPAVQFGLLPQELIQENLGRAEKTNRDRLQVLRELFENAGCSGESLSELPAGRSDLPNLSCRLPGSGAGSIVVGAHYDKVPAGAGVVDNWSGASLLPSLFRSLSSHPRHHTFEFVAFAAEKRGMVGSRAFVGSLYPGQLDSIRAMVNIDSLGTGPVRAQLDLSPELVCEFWDASELAEVPRRGVAIGHRFGSDYEPFQRAGVRIANFTSLTGDDAAIIHSGFDSMKRIDHPAYFESYRVLAIYLAVLDTQQLARGIPPSPSAAP